MKLLCKALLKLNKMKDLSPKKVLICILIAFFSGHLGPDAVNVLINSL